MISDLAERIALDLYGRSMRASVEMQHCVKCADEAFIFIDEASRKEYMISGYCQSCQDQIFKEASDGGYGDDDA